MIVRERSVMTSGGAILQHMESAKILKCRFQQICTVFALEAWNVLVSWYAVNGKRIYALFFNIWKLLPMTMNYP